MDRGLGVRDDLAEVLIEELDEEGSERRHSTADCEDHVEESGEGSLFSLGAMLSLEMATVEANVPIREIRNEADEARNDSVKTVGLQLDEGESGDKGEQWVDAANLHLGANELDERLSGCEDPSVHQTGRASCRERVCQYV